MEDTSLVSDFAVAPLPEPPDHRDQPIPRVEAIAPWWHTLAVLLMLGTWAGLSGKRTHSYEGTPHPLLYLSQIMMTWMLFGSVVAGIIHRRTFFFSTLRRRANTFLADVGRGLMVYAGIYISVITLAIVVGSGLLIFRAIHPAKSKTPSPTAPSAAKADPKITTPVPPPAPSATDPLDPFMKSRFHFDSKTVLAIAPQTLVDLLLWVLVSCTAGFCEEHIFRGYLLQQALAFTQRIGLSRLLATALSIITTSLIFGGLHLYEGIGGATLIAVLGIAYSIIALKLGNLRAVIVAHFLQDFVSGVLLFTLHKAHTF